MSGKSREQKKIKRKSKTPRQVRKELCEAELAPKETRDRGGSQIQEQDTRSNMTVLENTLQHLVKTQEIGSTVQTQLHLQTDQLLRVDRTLAEINASLERSERILKGMESWGGAIMKNLTPLIQEKPKLYDKTKHVGEPKKREKDTKEKAGATGDAFLLPKSLEGDEEFLVNILKILEMNKRYTLKSREKLLYYYYNSPNFVTRDKTENCLLVSNQRMVKLEKGKEAATVDMIDIAATDVAPGGTGRYEKLVLTLRFGEETFGIWGKDVCSFLCLALAKIAETNKIPVKPKELKDEEKETKKKPLKTKDSSSTTIAPGKQRELHPLEEKFSKDKKEEDKVLDVIIDSLDNLHKTGTEISKTLADQHDLMEHIELQIDKTKDRLENATEKVKKL